MYDKREIPCGESGHSWSKENLDAAGGFHSEIITWPTYSTLSLKKLYLLSLNESRFFVNTCATQESNVTKLGCR